MLYGDFFYFVRAVRPPVWRLSEGSRARLFKVVCLLPALVIQVLPSFGGLWAIALLDFDVFMASSASAASRCSTGGSIIFFGISPFV